MNNKHIKKVFDQIFQKDVINDYLLIKSIKKVAEKYHITTRQVSNILDDNKILHKPKRRTALNEKYFDRYDDEHIGPEVMYWAGFIAADGNVMNKSESRSYFMTVRLSIRDIEHLQKLQNSLGSTSKIRIHQTEGGLRAGKLWKTTESCVISFCSKYLVNSLENFNILPAKSKIYNIPEHLHKHKFINHFIRGYMDGDGCIMYDNKYKRLCFYGTQKCLEQISEIILQNCSIKKRKISINRTIFAIQYNGKDTIPLIKWLYKNSNMYLNRKFELIKTLIN